MKWRSLQESVPANSLRSLKEIYAERRGLIAKYAPAEIHAVHARAMDELEQSRIAEKALKVGHPAPDFQLPDQNGSPTRTADLVLRGPLVICFVRGRWCPFCVGQMEAMNAILPELGKLTASLVAISPQTVHQSSLMADQHKLAFPLLSDAGNRVAREFGLVYRVPDYEQEVYRRALVNLPFINGYPEWELPIPATYILGRKSSGQEDRSPEVLYAYSNPDYGERPEPADILAEVSQLQS